MKTLFKYNIILFTALLFVFLLIVSIKLQAQDSTIEKYSATMNLKYSRMGSEGREIKISLYRKEGRQFIPIQWAIINLYLNEISKMGMLGNITTDENGEGTIPLDKKFTYLVDSLKLNSYNFIGSLQNNPEIESIEEELLIQETVLTLTTFMEDTIKKAKVTLMAPDEEGNMMPVPDVDIYFGVKRLFSSLPIAEDAVTTDENGVAEIEFPGNIKGDETGNLHVIAKIDENDDYGTVFAYNDVKWGIPVIEKIQSDTRFLWSSRKNAPLSLVIITNSIILAVWGVIIYIVFQLLKIPKLTNKN